MSIPEMLRSEEFRFVLIRPKSKIPIGMNWQSVNGTNYKFDDLKLLNHLKFCGNVGIVCGIGNIVCVDCDNKEVSEAIDKGFSETFSYLTGSGNHNFLFKCENAEGNIKEISEHGEVFSLRCRSQQAIIPPSIHPNGKKYLVKRNFPVKEVSWKELLEALGPFMTKRYMPKTKIEKRILHTNKIDSIPIASVINLNELKRYGSEYQGSHPVHGSKTGMNFCVNTLKDMWHCFRCGSGGGALSWIAVQEGIISCRDAQAGAIKGELFKRVLKIAREKYGLNI